MRDACDIQASLDYADDRIAELKADNARLRKVMNEVACALHAHNRPTFSGDLRRDCRDTLWNALREPAP